MCDILPVYLSLLFSSPLHRADKLSDMRKLCLSIIAPANIRPHDKSEESSLLPLAPHQSSPHPSGLTVFDCFQTFEEALLEIGLIRTEPNCHSASIHLSAARQPGITPHWLSDMDYKEQKMTEIENK